MGLYRRFWVSITSRVRFGDRIRERDRIRVRGLGRVRSGGVLRRAGRRGKEDGSTQQGETSKQSSHQVSLL